MSLKDAGIAGMKSASLGELHLIESTKKILVPEGFSTTVVAFTDFLKNNNIEKKILSLLKTLSNQSSITIASLEAVSSQIHGFILKGEFHQEFLDELYFFYSKYVTDSKNSQSLSFAVRSSSTSEDMKNASFAGQQDTFLNIFGFENVVSAIKKVFASFYSANVLSYKIEKKIKLTTGSMCVCIQKMVPAATSGVIFSIEPESNFDKVLSITASYGLGEAIVQGIVNPDEFIVYKPFLSIIQKNYGAKLLKTVSNNSDYCLDDSIKAVELHLDEKNKFSLSESEILDLAAIGIEIEKYYGYPVDIEWAQDRTNNQMYILQVRPITTIKKILNEKKYTVTVCQNPLLSGKAIGKKAVIGKVRIINDYAQACHLSKNDILVTNMTNPSWEPIMNQVGGIITNLGGRTCHAAIIARELGIPAIVGSDNATDKLYDNQEITLVCCQGDIGNVYAGTLAITEEKIIREKSKKKIKTKLMLNISNPSLAFQLSQMPNDGVGLARIEFIISTFIKIHPKAIIDFALLPESLKEKIRKIIIGYENPIDYYVKKLSEGIATISAAFYPKQVIVRFSDFKSNEYRMLIGGELYEEFEENPMIGFRGASRYVSPVFADCFALECRAISYVRDVLQLKNVAVMIPFVRTITEAKKVIASLEKNNLKRSDDFKIIMMCEVPANALLAEEFLAYFDGFSIGSNDMTQLILGIDRDGNSTINNQFDERDPAVKKVLSMAIKECNKRKKYIGICGQGPSDHIDFADWLIKEGIKTMSLNADSIAGMRNFLLSQ